MQYIMVDVESDGNCPGIYNMICFGAVSIDDTTKTFYGTTRPITEKWDPEALAVSGFTREDTMKFDEPSVTMAKFEKWLEQFGRVHFISDNNGFDYGFINYYFHRFLGSNPFGHSSTNLNSLYKGMVKSTFKNCKHLRKTKHTHDPVDDCIGNIEALGHMVENMGLLI